MIKSICRLLQNNKDCIVIFLIVSLFFSCSKVGQESEPPILGANTSKLLIKIDGVNDKSMLKLQSSIESDQDDESNIHTLQEEMVKAASKFGDLEIGILSKENPVPNLLGGKDGISIVNSKLNGFQKRAATENLATGVKYCFLIYHSVTGVLLDAKIGTVGTPLEIGVHREGNYTWYAYSFNTTDMTLPAVLSDPEIRTRDDKPLLYKSGTISPANFSASDNFNLSVVFNHAIPKLNVEIDTRRMFGNISSVSASFEGNTLATGIFKIKSATIDPNSLIATIGKPLVFSNPDLEELRVSYLQGDHYTANIGSDFSVRFTNLTVTYPDPNATTQNLATSIFSPDALPPNAGAGNTGLVTFKGYTPLKDGAAKELIGQLQPSMILSAKSILHYGTNNPARGFEAQPGSASGGMIGPEDYNFGVLSKYVKIRGFSDRRIATEGKGNLALALQAGYPDILICSVLTPSAISATDMDELRKYLDKRGVVFLLTETTNVDVTNFFKNLFPLSTVTVGTHDGGGAVYKLNSVDPQVLNGIFGDVRGAYWGQDGSATQYLKVDPIPNDIVVYTKESVNWVAPTVSGVTMFRHKNLNLYFCGDTGFLSNERTGGGTSTEGNTGRPFTTRGGGGADKYFPISRTFGSASPAGSLDPNKPAGSWQASNGVIFANALGWLIERAHFNGVDRSP